MDKNMIISILSAHFFLFRQGMPNLESIQLICGIAIVLFLLLYFFLDFRKNFREKRKRTQSLQTFARKNNWAFEAKPKIEYLQRFHDFTDFDRDAKKIRNLLQKPFDQGLACVFDFSYIPDEGVEERFTAMAFYTPHLNLPDFMLRPYRLLHLVSAADFFEDHFKGGLAVKDVDLNYPTTAKAYWKDIKVAENMENKFDSDPWSSENYCLRGEDKLRIQQIFQPEVLRYFEGKLHFNVHGSGNYLIFYNGTIESSELSFSFQAALEIYGLFRR
jgi:hypothetical protein